MTIIDQFSAHIPQAIGDNLVLQCFFLHHLFPENFDVEEARTQREAFGPQFSYKLVAADGFDWASRGLGGFVTGMDWLIGIQLPTELLQHEIALLGIALGMRKTKKTEWHDWWTNLLHRLNLDGSRNLATLLAVVSGMQPYAPRSNSLDELDLAQGFFCQPPQWEGELIATYFNKMRKQAFPYHKDFFRLMLAIFLMDQAMTHAMQSSKSLDDLRQAAAISQMEKTEQALNAFVDRRARIWVSSIATLGLATVLMACTLLFVGQEHATELRGLWDLAKWITLWVSGPIPACLIALRILYFALRGKPILLDLPTLHSRCKTRLLQRWRRRLLLPSPHNP